MKFLIRLFLTALWCLSAAPILAGWAAFIIFLDHWIGTTTTLWKRLK